MAVWIGPRKALADTASGRVRLSEGSGIALGIGCPIAGAKNAAEANAFVQFLLTPEIRSRWPKRGIRTATRTVDLKPKNASGSLTAMT